jgi:hypothetical protein
MYLTPLIFSMRRFILLLAVMVLAASAGNAATIAVSPASGRSIRLDLGQYLLLDFLSVMNPSDRAILEYDVSDLSPSVPLVTLDISFGNLDYPSAPEGIVDIFAFIGDGTVTGDDFYAGGPTPLISFVGENGPEYGYISIDVTSAVKGVLAGGGQYIGFRLSTETTDRFFLGEAIDVPNPVLTAVPEPLTLSILALGSLLVRGRRSRQL